MMKRVAVLASGSLMLSVAAVCAQDTAAAAAALTAPLRVEAYKATGPVVVDGLLTEECWKQAVSVPLGYNDKRPGQLNDNVEVVMKVTWDDQYLYVGYDVNDENIIAADTGEAPQGPENNRRVAAVADPGGKADFVEFFFTFNDPNFMWEIHHNAANNFADIWCVVPDKNWPLSSSTLHLWGVLFCKDEYIKDDGAYTVRSAVHMKPGTKGRWSTVNDETDTDLGYTAEIRLPWRGLGAPREWETKLPYQPGDKYRMIRGPWKIAGKSISVLGVCHRAELPENYYHSSPTRKGDWFHKTVPDWPLFNFVEKKEDKTDNAEAGQ